MGPFRWTAAYVLCVVQRKLVVHMAFQRLSREDLITVQQETGTSFTIVMLAGLQDIASGAGQDDWRLT